MADLLELSARIIDEGRTDEPVNRITMELSEVHDGLAVVEAFSHVWALATGEGLVLFDTSHSRWAGSVKDSLRRWSADPVHTIVYTHGHVDHVGGGRTFVAEADERGDRRPQVVGHRHVARRFDRYQLTDGYNTAINRRQFGGTRLGMGGGGFYEDWVRPDTEVDERLTLEVGGTAIELVHDRGETDDHLWAWVPERRAVLAGDFVIWAFPNAGNPQKVQRWPVQWAEALRRMAALEPELLLPAHGLPVSGQARVRQVLSDTAEALETVVEQTLHLMNEGAPLDQIVHSVRVPDHLLARPYLRPTYDEPEFIVHNVWRLYGGWYDGNPAHLKPAPDTAVATEVARLAGGAEALARRALEASEAGDHRLACQLVEWAVQADWGEPAAHRARAQVYTARRKTETSLMAKGIYGTAAAESEEAAGGS